MENGIKVLNFGSRLNKVTKYSLISLVISLPVLFIGIILFYTLGESYYLPLYLTLKGHFGFVNFLFLIDYLGIIYGLFGTPLYFLSFIYIGIGQTAINTTKE